MNWFNKAPKKPETLYEVVLEYFIYSYVDNFIYSIIFSYGITFICGLLCGFSPFFFYYGIKLFRKFGCKCMCFCWFIILTIIISIITINMLMGNNFPNLYIKNK